LTSEQFEAEGWNLRSTASDADPNHFLRADNMPILRKRAYPQIKDKGNSWSLAAGGFPSPFSLRGMRSPFHETIPGRKTGT